jgi:hypothetical protein
MNLKNSAFGKFLIIWIGEFISSIGSGLTAFALGVYVFQTTGSAAAVSLTTLFAFLPTILLHPVGGVLADRFDRRLMMICGDLFSAIGLIFMLICLQTGELKLWQIYIGVTISAVFAALLEPAYKATITDLLSEEDYAKASGMMQLAASAKYLLSPIIGGLLLTVTDISTIFIIDISTLVVTVIIVTFIKGSILIRKQNGKRLQLLEDMKEGWHALSNNRGVMTIVILISVATFYLGLLQTLISPMILSFSNSKVLGIIESVSAVGMLIGSIHIGILRLRSYVSTLAAGFCFAGVFIACMGISTNLILIAIAGVLFFSALPFVNTSAEVMIRCRIPNELQGRAWGLISIISQMGYILAYAASGLLADRIFNPMFLTNGLLVGTVGKLIGTGPGRGIGFMLILSGMFIIVLGLIIRKMKTIKAMEPVAKHFKADMGQGVIPDKSLNGEG